MRRKQLNERKCSHDLTHSFRMSPALDLWSESFWLGKSLLPFAPQFPNWTPTSYVSRHCLVRTIFQAPRKALLYFHDSGLTLAVCKYFSVWLTTSKASHQKKRQNWEKKNYLQLPFLTWMPRLTPRNLAARGLETNCGKWTQVKLRLHPAWLRAACGQGAPGQSAQNTVLTEGQATGVIWSWRLPHENSTVWATTTQTRAQ